MSRRTDSAAFLTWNDSTRSVELSRRLGMPRAIFVAARRGVLRHVIGTIQSAWFLATRRPVVVWYQFSLMLGVVVRLYRLLGRRRGIRTVADIHTKAMRRSGPQRLRRIVRRVKAWALCGCDCVIVSNENNAAYAREAFGLEPVVLPDPLPQPPRERLCISRRADVVFICSFAADEPLTLIEEVAARLSNDLVVAVTGDPSLVDRSCLERLGRVAWLTGFRPIAEYWALLRETRAVVVLSTEPDCLPCGAYEAIAVGHRPVIADDPTNRGVFGRQAEYTKLEASAVVAAIGRATSCPRKEPDNAYAAYESAWERRWIELQPRLTRTESIAALSTETARCSRIGEDNPQPRR